MMNANPSRFVIYLCHGGKKFFDQTIFSALTLLDLLLAQKRRDYQIVIYTDKPDAFPRHDLIRPIKLTPEEIETYKGPLEFIHRVKLKILQRAEAEVGLAYVYVDCDTRWLKLPDTAFEALSDRSQDKPVAYLYEIEGMMSPNFHPHHFRALKENRDLLLRYRLQTDPPWTAWNSGVVAFAETTVKAGIIDDALALSDDLILFFRSRILIEQLALSLIAQSHCQPRSFEDFLVHYWRHTLALPVVLERFFHPLDKNMSVEQLAQACGAFVIDEDELQRINDELTPRGLKKIGDKYRNSIRKRRVDFRAWRIRLRSRRSV